MTAHLELLREVAHTPDATRAQRAEAVRAALPAVAAGCVVTRDYLRAVAGLDVAPGEARELDALCQRGSAALACAWQVAEMRYHVARALPRARIMIRDNLWVEYMAPGAEVWVRRGLGLVMPRAARHPREHRRWTACVGWREFTVLSWRERSTAIARWGVALEVGPTLRAALEAATPDPDQIQTRRASVAALRDSEDLSYGWISARLDLEQGDPAALRLARLLRREEEV